MIRFSEEEYRTGARLPIEARLPRRLRTGLTGKGMTICF